jgi:hypothetical protein
MSRDLLRNIGREEAQSTHQESLPGEGTPKLPLLESILGGKLLSVLNQIGNFVGNFFQLLSRLASALGWERYGHANKLILISDPIMGIGETADGSVRTEAWAGVQRHMKCFAVRPVDYRRVCGESNEKFPAVCALVAISLQGRTPGSISPETVTERSVRGEKLGVRKTPIPGAPQTVETTRAQSAGSGIRQTHDFRTPEALA